MLVGTETRNRKHVDWELKSSMIDGSVNKKSGILVINLPSTGCTYCTATHKDEKKIVYPEINSWMSIDERSEYERRYPYLPARIIDNLLLIFLAQLILINLILGVFNLIPIPPLDGSKILFGFLPSRYDNFKRKLSVYGPWILVILLILDNIANLHIFSRIFIFFIDIIEKLV